jgi:putative SOS response-associated peptidase YedK
MGKKKTITAHLERVSRLLNKIRKGGVNLACATCIEDQEPTCDDVLGMPSPPRTGGPPVTNIRNTTSPHWRMWLKPENRCLVPANSFAEYAPDPNAETKKKDEV